MNGVLRIRGIAAALTFVGVMFATPSAAMAAESVLTPLTMTTVPPVQAVQVQPRPLHDIVISYVDFGNQTDEQMCLAKAVFFEARSESLEGQLAVAQVILNRVASPEYPDTICEVVTQRAQFSFIRDGKFPTVDTSNQSWHTALAIADAAEKHLATEVASDVLWYHADYVAPAWGHWHTKFAQIGAHIFYS